MPVDIVVGGQYGSEGKGHVASYLAPEYKVSFRGGSENAGHTHYVGGARVVNQVVPVAFRNSRCFLVVANGASFSIPQLKEEVVISQELGLDVSERLVIEPNAMIITEADKEKERRLKMGKSIGSTMHGCGAAQARKILRQPGTLVAGMYPELDQYTKRNVDNFDWRDPRHPVLLEGTQGTFLSIDHTPLYPKATSRNAIASGIASECGYGPKQVRDVFLVVRTFPIRVAGDSGPVMGEEITWDEVGAWSKRKLVEKTTVTKKVRRVFTFSMEEVKLAVRLNSPTQIALMFADYLAPGTHGKTTYNSLPAGIHSFIYRLEDETGVPVTLIGTGPRTIIDVREESNLEEWKYPWS